MDKFTTKPVVLPVMAEPWVMVYPQVHLLVEDSGGEEAQVHNQLLGDVGDGRALGHGAQDYVLPQAVLLLGEDRGEEDKVDNQLGNEECHAEKSLPVVLHAGEGGHNSEECYLKQSLHGGGGLQGALRAGESQKSLRCGDTPQVVLRAGGDNSGECDADLSLQGADGFRGVLHAGDGEKIREGSPQAVLVAGGGDSEEVLGDRGNNQAVQQVGDDGEEGQQVLRVRGGRHAAHLYVAEEVLGDRGNGQAVQRVGGDD